MTVKFEGKVTIRADEWQLSDLHTAQNLKNALDDYVAEIMTEAINNALEEWGYFEFCGSDYIGFIHAGFDVSDGGNILYWRAPLQECVDRLDDQDMRRGSEDADFALALASNFRRWASEIEAKIVG